MFEDHTERVDLLSPIDVTFLDAEEGGPPLTIAAVMVVEGPPPSLDELTDMIARRVPEIPRLRQRVMPMPYDMVRPIWVEAEHFDVSDHVHFVPLPPPGRLSDLEETVGDLVTFPLRHDLPLWDAWLLDGLEGDRWALLVRMHHAAVDGVGGSMMMLRLFDSDPEGGAFWREEPTETGHGTADSPGATVDSGAPTEDRTADAGGESAADTGRGAATAEGAPSDRPGEPGGRPGEPSAEVRAIAAAVDQQVRHVAGRLNSLLDSARHGDVTRRASETLRGLTAALTSAAAPSHSALSGPVGPGRRWVTAQVPLEDLRPIRRRFGGTVNDVALTAVAGAIRHLLVERGERIAKGMVKVFVPVSQRTEVDSVGTNRISGMVAELPIGDIDAVERLRQVAGHLGHLKSSGESAALGALISAAAWAPTPLTRLGVRLGAPHVIGMIDTIATNVPGPPFPLFLGGREILAIYPYVPIREPLRMVVGIFSYNGSLYLGVTGDTASLPDLEAVPGAFVRTVGELVERSRRAVTRTGSTSETSDSGETGDSGGATSSTGAAEPATSESGSLAAGTSQPGTAVGGTDIGSDSPLPQ